jgi:hypothetical protein
MMIGTLMRTISRWRLYGNSEDDFDTEKPHWGDDIDMGDIEHGDSETATKKKQQQRRKRRKRKRRQTGMQWTKEWTSMPWTRTLSG